MKRVACRFRVSFFLFIFFMFRDLFLYPGCSQKTSVKNSRWDKAASFLMLFLFMTIVRYACMLIRKAPAQLDLISVTDARWYALGMFFWYAAAILLKKANPRLVMGVSVLLSMVAGYFTGHTSTFAWLRAVNFFPFFYAGLMTDPGRLTELTGRKRIRTFSVLILLVAAALAAWKVKGLAPWRLLFRGAKAYAQIDTELPLWSGAFWRLAAFPVSAAVSLAWLSLMPGKAIPNVSGLGGKTLSVYAFHSPAYKTILYFLPFLDEWIRKSPVPLGLLFSALVLVLCSLPAFDRSVRRFMNLVVKKEENHDT